MRCDQNQVWLSRVAMNHIRSFRQRTNAGAGASGRDIYAYSVISLLMERNLYHKVLPSLLVQLLRNAPHALRNDTEYNNLLQEISGLQSQPSETTMEKIALQVISLFDESETVYIIVDMSGDDYKKGPWSLDPCFMAVRRALVKMVLKAQAKLRVLITDNKGSWDVWGPTGEPELASSRVIIHDVRPKS